MWEGSAFDCTSSKNVITLLHNRYNTVNGESGTCSDGDLVLYGESLSIGNDYYTSRINATVNSKLTGSTITINCFHDNGTKQELVKSYFVTIKSSDTLSICTDSPGNASLSDVQSEMASPGIIIMHAST